MQDSVDKQLITISGTRVHQVFGGSPRKLHNHFLPKGYPAITFGNRGIVDFFGNIVFSYGFFVILFSVIYIRRLFCSGVPNNGFLLQCIENTFLAIQTTFRSLEMYSKRSCKVRICSVILGDLESVRNFKGFNIIFPKILDTVKRIT